MSLFTGMWAERLQLVKESEMFHSKSGRKPVSHTVPNLAQQHHFKALAFMVVILNQE